MRPSLILKEEIPAGEGSNGAYKAAVERCVCVEGVGCAGNRGILVSMSPAGQEAPG